MSIEKALEMARCVEINLKNMVRVMPFLEHHPILFLAKDQIKECVKELEKENDC